MRKGAVQHWRERKEVDRVLNMSRRDNRDHDRPLGELGECPKTWRGGVIAKEGTLD